MSAGRIAIFAGGIVVGICIKRTITLLLHYYDGQSVDHHLVNWIIVGLMLGITLIILGFASQKTDNH